MDVMQRVRSLGRYLWRAQSHQRIHSPFVFDFCREVLYKKDDFRDYLDIEQLRQQLVRDSSTIQVSDFGAGGWKSRERRVSDIAKTSLKRKKYAQLLFRIAHYYQPPVTLELGTSLGITTAYIGSGHPGGQVFTIEGCPNIAAIAQSTFDQLQLSNIRPFVGNFDLVLEDVLQQAGTLGLVFIDGNHMYEPTLRYFETTLEQSNNDTIFIFDDIHWSREMEDAWYRIQQHPRVTLSIDLYEMGIVFIRKELKEKEHFTIRF